jgi:hypothetical protein
MLADVHTTGVNWASIGTIFAGVAGVGALIMGRLEANRKELRQTITSEINTQLIELRERVARLEGPR